MSNVENGDDPAITRPPPDSPHSFQGYYINLDRSLDRRDAVQRQFASLGVSDQYQRFSAIDGAKLQRIRGIATTWCFSSMEAQPSRKIA